MADVQTGTDQETPASVVTVVEVVKSPPHVVWYLFEWAMALALVFMAMLIFAYPDSVDASAFYKVLNLVGNPYILATIYFVVGVTRFAVQLITHKRWGPHARAVMSLLCSMIWLHMVAAFVMIIPERGVPSPSIGMYLSLTLAEWYATYRAAAAT